MVLRPKAFAGRPEVRGAGRIPVEEAGGGDQGREEDPPLLRRGPAALRPAAESLQGYLADIRGRALRAARDEPLSVVRGRGGLQEAELRRDRPHDAVDFRGVPDFQAGQRRVGLPATVLEVSFSIFFFYEFHGSRSARPGWC